MDNYKSNKRVMFMRNGDVRAARRNFLKMMAVGGTIVIGGFKSPAFAQAGGKHIFFLPFDLIVEFVFELNAVVGGHFKAQGLDIDVVNVRGTAITVQQLLAKRASFGEMGALDLMKANASQKTQAAPEKSQLVSIATIAQSGIFATVSLKSAPIMSPEDMRGKTIGVLSIGGGTENMLDLMLAAANIPAKDVPRQAIGGGMASVELLKQNRVAAFVTTVETVIAIERAKEPVVAWNVERFAPLPGQIYAVTTEFMEANPAIVTKTLRALLASHREVNSSDVDKILDRINSKYEITGDKDRGFQREALKAHIKLNLSQGPQNLLRNMPALWNTSAALFHKAGFAKLEAGKLYTNRFIDEAYRS